MRGWVVTLIMYGLGLILGYFLGYFVAESMGCSSFLAECNARIMECNQRYFFINGTVVN